MLLVFPMGNPHRAETSITLGIIFWGFSQRSEASITRTGVIHITHRISRQLQDITATTILHTSGNHSALFQANLEPKPSGCESNALQTERSLLMFCWQFFRTISLCTHNMFVFRDKRSVPTVFKDFACTEHFATPTNRSDSYGFLVLVAYQIQSLHMQSLNFVGFKRFCKA